MPREGEVRHRFEAVEARQMELAQQLWELWRVLMHQQRRLEALEQPRKRKSRRRGTKK